MIKHYKKTLYLYFLFSLTLLSNLKAQSGLSLTAGVGIYELTNIGVQWNMGKTGSLSAYGGSNFGLYNKTLWSVGFSFDQVFLKPNKWKIKPGYSIGVLLWTQDDNLYHFKSFSMPFMLLASYPLSPSIKVRLEGGVIISDVLTSDRKQNVQSGFPDRFNPNFRLNFVYKLKFNEK